MDKREDAGEEGDGKVAEGIADWVELGVDICNDLCVDWNFGGGLEEWVGEGVVGYPIGSLIVG